MKRSIKYAAVAIVCSLVSCFLEEFVGAMCMLGWLVAPIFGILAIVNCLEMSRKVQSLNPKN